MKKAVVAIAALFILFTGVAYAAENDTNNTTNGFLPDINLPPMNTSNLDNATHTGVGPVDDTVNFLIGISPFLLLILGIIILLLSGFARIIGIVLIILAVIRILWLLFMGS